MNYTKALEIAINLLEIQSSNSYTHGKEKMIEMRKAVVILEELLLKINEK